MPWMQHIAPAIFASLWQAALGYLLLFGLRRSGKTSPIQTYRIGMGLLLLLTTTFLYTLSGPDAPGITGNTLFPEIKSNFINNTISYTYIILFAINTFISFRKENLIPKGLDGNKASAPTHITRQLDNLRLRIGLRRSITISLQENIVSPLTKGVLKPTILLPLSAVNGLTASQMEAVLLHELWHIKRLDYIWLLVQCIMDKIGYFNPFFLLISKAVREDREMACDLCAMRSSKAFSVTEYISSLLYFARTPSTAQSTAVLQATGNRKSELYNRAAYLLENKKNRKYQGKTWMNVMAVMALGYSLALFYTGESAVYNHPPADSPHFADIRRTEPQSADLPDELTYKPIAAAPQPQKREKPAIPSIKKRNNTSKPIGYNKVASIEKSKKRIAISGNTPTEENPNNHNPQPGGPSLAGITTSTHISRLKEIAAPDGQKTFVIKVSDKEDADRTMGLLARGIYSHFAVQTSSFQYAAYVSENRLKEENTLVMLSDQYTFQLRKENGWINLTVRTNQAAN